MRSTQVPAETSPPAPWRAAGLRYYAFSFFCGQKFGGRAWKVSLDGGFSCPNRDGTLSTGGCIFCNPESFSPSRRLGPAPIRVQLEEGIRRVRARHGAGAAERLIAYFQPGTNTYAPLPRLRVLLDEAISYPGIVGLAIGTRPDCVGDDVLDLLAEMSQKTWLNVEFGLQTIHDRTLDWLCRGHHYDAFVDAATRCRQRGLGIGAHVILGLPGETPDDMRATAREIGRLGVGSVKLHNLYAVHDTRLGEMVQSGQVRLPERDEYAGYVADFLEELPADCVVDRLSGDAPPQYLIAPKWCLDKPAIRAAIEAEFDRRGSWQGQRHFPSPIVSDTITGEFGAERMVAGRD
jgi:uncharacterized protein